MIKIAIGFIVAAFLGIGALIGVVSGLVNGVDISNMSAVIPMLLFSIVIGYFSWIRLKNWRLLKGRAEVISKKESETKDYIRDAMHKGLQFKYLGGSGYKMGQSELYLAGIYTDKVRFVSTKYDLIDIDYSIINSFEIGGAGTTTTNAGISGGGFGLEGFIKGAVTAAVINAATTKSTTNTLLKITSKNGEIFLHTSMCEPQELQMILSPLSISLSNRSEKSTASVADELAKLNDLVKAGVITEEDFNNAKIKLISK